MSRDVPVYDELQFRLTPGRDGYDVLAIAAGGAAAHGVFALPFSPEALENFRLAVDPGTRRMRGSRSLHREKAKRFGAQLFEALVADPSVRGVYAAARHDAEHSSRGLRITLYLTRAPELADVPWEFLYQRPDFLAQSVWTPVVRYLDLPESRRPLHVSPPLRILGMVSRPLDEELAELDVEREKAHLEEALSGLVAAGQVEMRWLPQATLRALQHEVAHGDDFHIFHYIGHGEYDESSGEGSLVLERPDGRPLYVSGERLGSLLCDRRTMRLAVLNACEAAKTAPQDPLAGVAANLIEHEVPAVVGMQFAITDDGAIAFAEEFYTTLAEGYPVDAAVTEARRAMAADDEIEWGTPVLFMRVADGRLFDLGDTADTHQAGEPGTTRLAAGSEVVATVREADRAADIESRPESGLSESVTSEPFAPGDVDTGRRPESELSDAAVEPLAPDEGERVRERDREPGPEPSEAAVPDSLPRGDAETQRRPQAEPSEEGAPPVPPDDDAGRSGPVGPPRRPGRPESPSPPRRRVPLVLGGVVALVAVIVVAVLALGGGGDGGDNASPPAVKKKPKANPPARVTASLSLGGADAPPAPKGGGKPFGVTVGKGSVWVSNGRRSVVMRIDPKTNTVAEEIPVDRGPTEPVLAAGALWTPNAIGDSVSRVEVDPPHAVRSFHVGNKPDDAAFGAGLVWMPLRFANAVIRIDPERGRVVGRPIPVGREPGDVAFGAGAVWVTNALDDTLMEIDPEQARVVRRVKVGHLPEDVAFGFGSVWVANLGDGTVTRVDPGSGRVVGQPVRTGAETSDVTIGFGSVWAVNNGADTVVRIDPKRMKLVGRPIRVGDQPIDIAAGQNALWVTDFASASLTRIDP